MGGPREGGGDPREIGPSLGRFAGGPKSLGGAGRRFPESLGGLSSRRSYDDTGGLLQVGPRDGRSDIERDGGPRKEE